MMRASFLRFSPLLVLAAALVALVVFFVHDTPPAAQAQTQETVIWSGTLTVQSLLGTNKGCDNSISGKECSTSTVLTDDDFTYEGVTYSVIEIERGLDGATPILSVLMSLDVSTALDDLDLVVQGYPAPLDVQAASHSGSNGYLRWVQSDFPAWSDGDTIKLTLVRPVYPGDLDPTFSSASAITTEIGSGNDRAYATAVQADGKIVVVGDAGNGSNFDFAVARYTADGVLDTSFSSDGKLVTTFGTGDDNARAVAIQSDGKIVVAGFSRIAARTDIAVARYTADGTLDTTFSSDGKVTTDINSNSRNDQAHAVAIQSDGKIVVAGASGDGTTWDFVVARFTAAGALDTTFGTDGADAGSDPDGFVTTAFNTQDEFARAVAIQSDGKIVVAGESGDGSTWDFAVARYTTAGVEDTSFSSDGKVVTQIGSKDDFARAVAIQSDGKIVVAGYAAVDGQGTNFALARYTAAGAPDNSFDSDGKVITRFGGSNTADQEARAMSIQSDDKIVVAGMGGNGSNKDFLVARYTTAGALDTGFNGNGWNLTAIGSGNDEANAVAILDSGNILAAGYRHNGSNNDFALAAYDADGAPADILDGPGWLTTNVGSGAGGAFGVALQPDDKIVAVGFDGSDYVLARYNADGSLDTTFDSDGYVTTDIGSTFDIWYAVAIQSDGKIVVAGVYHNGSNFDFAVARYTSAGALDTTFGTDHDSSGSPDGYVTTAIGSGTDRISAMALQSDGKIVVAGRSNNGSNEDFVVARYTTAGVLDTTFGTDGADSNTDPDGYVTTAIGSSDERILALALQTDGKIVVAGYSNNGSNDDFAVARYTTAGVLDTTFDSDGYVTTGIGSGNAAARAVAIQSDGKIVAAGRSSNGTNDDFAVARYTTAGVLDTTFGTDHDSSGSPDGYVTTAIGSGDDGARSTSIQAEGKIVAAGYSNNGSNNDFAVARYTTAGVLDTSFAGDGKVTTAIGSLDDSIYAIALQSGGEIVAAGSSSTGSSTSEFAVARYLESGTPVVRFASSARTTTEGNSAAVDLYSSPAPAADIDVNISISTNGAVHQTSGGSCEAGKDFRLAYTAVDVPAGTSKSLVSPEICDDNVPEGNESFTITLQPGTGYVLGSPSSYTVVINDDDTPAAPTVLTLSSGDTKLDVSWTAPPGTLTGYDVHYTSNATVANDAATQGGGAAAGWVDAGHSGTTASDELTGLSNNQAHRVRVRGVSSAGAGAWVHGTGTPATKPSVSLTASPNPVTEGSSVTVTATLSKAHTSSVTIPLTLTAGTAESSDFGALASITVASGQTSGTGTIRANHDADADDETFTVALGSSLPTAVLAGSPSSVLVTITDDEKPTVRLSASPNPVEEGSAVTITATLTAALSTDVTIPLTLTAGTAESSDFGTLASITVTAGQTTGTGTISTSHDAGEDDETFTVALGSSLPASVLAGSPSSVEVRIKDDEGTPAVSLSASPNPVAEGSSVTVTATLSKAHTSSVTIPLTLTAGTAETSDFGTLSSIRIASGATSGTGTVRANHDADADDETFTVAVGSPLPQGVLSGSPSSVLITITDDDKPSTNANLGNLTASSASSAGGSYTPLALSPAFSASTTSYAATVVSTVSHARLTPTVADTGKATVQVGKSGSLNRVSSGRASAAIPLDDGANAIIVRVTAEDGTTTRDYTVTITRAPRPKVSLSASPNPVTPQPDPDDPHDPPQKKAQVTITATLDRALPETVFIPVTLTQDPNPDHGVISAIGIQANALSGSHIMNVYDDIDNEDDTFTVALDTVKLPETVAAGTPASVTVTIKDTDSKAAPGQVGNFTVTPKVRYLHATWERPAARTTRYDVQFKTAAAPNQMATDHDDPSTGWVALPKGGAYSPDFTDRRITMLPDGLTPGTAYDVRVRAVNWKAAGPWATGRGTPKAPRSR